MRLEKTSKKQQNPRKYSIGMELHKHEYQNTSY